MERWNRCFGTGAVLFLTVFLSTAFLAGNGHGNPLVAGTPLTVFTRAVDGIVGTRSTVSLQSQPTQASNADKSTPQLSDSRSQTQNPKLDHPEFIQKTQKLHMPFIANEGQMDERVAFYAKTFGGTVFVTKDGEIVYSLPQSGKAEDRSHNVCCGEPTPRRDTVLRVPTTTVALKEEFIGAKISGIKGEGESITKVSYFKGNDPSKWKSNISTYELINLGEIYDGIELKLKAHGNNVEKLLYVKPGADTNQIKISLSGLQPSKNPPPLSPSVRGTYDCPPLAGVGGGAAGGGLESGSRLEASLPVRVCTQTRGLWINEEGQLEAETALGTVKFTKPIAYQEIDGKRVEIETAYVIRDREALSVNGLKNTDTDNGHEKTHLPTGTDNGHASRIYSFTVASYDRTKDLVIDPLLASTYLGGSEYDYGQSLTLDTSGNVYVIGYTTSTDFPTTSGAYDTSYNGYGDVFVSKLNSGLTSLLASTYLGGSGYEYGWSLALDTNGNVYVTGYTGSTDFPTTSGAYDTSWNGADADVFVSKLDGGLTSLLASTYLGGSEYDYGYSLALDTSGNVYVAGRTGSTDFPTASGAYDTSYNGDGNYGDVFVSKLDGGLTSLLASTYLGGSGQDGGNSLTLDTSGNVYVTGFTGSSDFPITSGAYDTSFNGYADVFVSKLDGGLASLLTSTFLGGFDGDYGQSLALDTSGHVYVTGDTSSSNFPTTSGAYDTSFNGNSWYYDVFVSKLDGGLTSLLASTYLGGSAGYDYGYFLALDTSGNVYVEGITGSQDFPTTSGAYDTSWNGGGEDTFVSKLNSGLTRLLASTYLGGSGSDEGFSLALDTSGHVYVTGYTGSPNFPTTSGAYDTFNGSDGDVFVSKLDGNLSADTASYMNSLSPYLGPQGTLLTINGFNFGDVQGSGVVHFGATPASVTSWTDTSITLPVPELPSKVYNVSVTTKGQKSNSISFLLTKTPSSEGNFSMEVRPSTQTVVRGSSAPYSIFIKPINGFNEAVTLEVVGLQQGATAEFQRNPVSPGEWVDLTITTTKQTPLKVHSFIVKGSTSSLNNEKSAKLQVKPAKPVVSLKRSYSSDLTVLLIAKNKTQTGDTIIANISLMNTTGTWIKATLKQEEHSVAINKDEDYVILLGPYATKSLGEIKFLAGESLRYDGDRVSFEPLTVLAIDLFLRGALGQEVPPNAFFDVYSHYEYAATLLGDLLGAILNKKGCYGYPFVFGMHLQEGNVKGMLYDLAKYLNCMTVKNKEKMEKLLIQVLKNKELAGKATTYLTQGVGKILYLLKVPDHYVEFCILMCPSLVPPITNYAKFLGLCDTLGAPLEGFVRLEAVAEEQSNKK